MEIKEKYIELSRPIIEIALEEDIQSGDITTNAIIPKSVYSKGIMVAKENGIVCGLDLTRRIFTFLGKTDIVWKTEFDDGDKVSNGQILAEIKASHRILLSAERTALNFLQRMSGIATKTKLFVEQLEGTNTLLLDTRKTGPGLRYLDKYSALIGGAENHRFGLYDMIMIKDNHIKTAGSITNAVEQIRGKYHNKYKIEIETSNIEEVKEAIRANIDIIMLDNMPIKMMTECVEYIDGRVKTEASGNINLENIREVALTGVDYISVGSITHSVKAFDISMLVK